MLGNHWDVIAKKSPDDCFCSPAIYGVMSCRDPFLALPRETCVVRPDDDDDIDGGSHFMIRSNDGSVDVEQNKIIFALLLKKVK